MYIYYNIYVYEYIYIQYIFIHVYVWQLASVILNVYVLVVIVVFSVQLSQKSAKQDVGGGAAASQTQQDDSLLIIDSIIEESQKGNVGEVAELLDQLQADARGQAEPTEENGAREAAPAVDPRLAERPEDRRERAAASDGARSLPEPSDPPRPSGGSRDGAQPPDVTSGSAGRRPLDGAAGEQEEERRAADILERALPPFADSDSSGPTKPPRQLTAEPDIVASTKKPPPSRPPPPAGGPPPRPPPPSWQSLPSKKSQECLRPLGLEVCADADAEALEPSGLVSPSSTVRSLTKELQHSLDLASATSGEKVVTAQENEDEAAEGGGGGGGGGATPGPQRPRSDSGRELTDEEILASVMIKNLDTGEEIPLIQAEEKLPAGINPLTLHIMRRTKEYIMNDAAQSDDDDKAQAPLVDTDGGKLKQKT
ncbi:WD repeat-containing protein 44 [Liparis tanakae]|uniref:WD repeat-containing protein 44 n=1 Tax=Liparis tanakae TaxID=230148 RepID=A0A4Z2EIN5_9TELE|nr:WD repeat-containing protein 44 [Liparis tanakae]